MIFTFGYQGRDPGQLQQRIAELDACLVDIRFKPQSRQPGWGQAALQTRFGGSYLWLQEFGNESFDQGEISLYKLSMGLAIVRDILTSCDVVLMCVCRNYESCHRKAVAEYLRKVGLDSEELTL